jgi:hypothetical protein
MMKSEDRLPNYESGPRELCVRSIRKTIEALEAGELLRIECDGVALRAQSDLESGYGAIPEQYGFLQFLLDLTRKELARAYDAESQETRAIQGDMFTGHLQAYYPIPHKRGEKPVYVKLEALNVDQLRWNAEQHRKVGNAHLRHADALDAYADRKAQGEAA